MSSNEMSAKIRELKELQQLIEEATAEAEAIKDAIKAEMEARSVDEITVDVFKVRWTKVTSSRIDTTAFKRLCRSWRSSSPRKPKAAGSAWHNLETSPRL